jgi:hypothetical protein
MKTPISGLGPWPPADRDILFGSVINITGMAAVFSGTFLFVFAIVLLLLRLGFGFEFPFHWFW